MSTILRHMVCLIANLECRSVTCCTRLAANLECMSKMRCTRLAENTGHTKSPFWHHRTTYLLLLFFLAHWMSHSSCIFLWLFLLVLIVFSQYLSRDWLGRASPRFFLYRVGFKTLIINQCSCVVCFLWNRADHYILVHGQVTIIFVVSVCLSVCLFVCAEFFSAVFDLISIKLGHMLYVWV